MGARKTIYGRNLRAQWRGMSPIRRGYTGRPPPTATDESKQRMATKKTLYKVQFMNQGQVYEVYAKSVGHGSMFGFVEVEELVFGERSSVVLDPSEEKIKSEFKGVKRTFLPMHAILRIDEVDKQGTSKISKLEGNVTQFPMPMYAPGDEKGN